MNEVNDSNVPQNADLQHTQPAQSSPHNKEGYASLHAAPSPEQAGQVPCDVAPSPQIKSAKSSWQQAPTQSATPHETTPPPPAMQSGGDATRTWQQAPSSTGFSQQTPVYPEQSKGFAIAALVLGIVSVVSSFIFFISLPCSILGCVFGGIGMAKNLPAKGMSIAGLVLSIVGLLIAAFFVILAVWSFYNFRYIVHDYWSYGY